MKAIDTTRPRATLECEKCGRRVTFDVTTPYSSTVIDAEADPPVCPFHGGSTYYLRPVREVTP